VDSFTFFFLGSLLLSRKKDIQCYLWRVVVAHSFTFKFRDSQSGTPQTEAEVIE